MVAATELQARLATLVMTDDSSRPKLQAHFTTFDMTESQGDAILGSAGIALIERTQHGPAAILAFIRRLHADDAFGVRAPGRDHRRDHIDARLGGAGARRSGS